MKTHEEAMEIFKQFNIQAEEVEPTVYKVLNNKQEINIYDLEFELKECFLLISNKQRSERNKEGYKIKYAPVFYILLDCNKGDLMDKYYDISQQERITVIRSYKYNPNYVESIDTIYTAEELGLTEA